MVIGVPSLLMCNNTTFITRCFSSGFAGLATMFTFCPGITVFGMATLDFCEKHPNSKVPYHYYKHVGNSAQRDHASECNLFKSVTKDVNTLKHRRVHDMKTEHEIYLKWKQTRNLTFKSPDWS